MVKTLKFTIKYEDAKRKGEEEYEVIKELEELEKDKRKKKNWLGKAADSIKKSPGSAKKYMGNKIKNIGRPDYVKVVMGEFKKKKTGVFDAEVDKWIEIIDGHYSKGVLDKYSYDISTSAYMEKTEKQVDKLKGIKQHINHINTPSEIEFYKKINQEKKYDWLGAISATGLNKAPLDDRSVYNRGGITTILLDELIPKRSNRWWDANNSELKVSIKRDKLKLDDFSGKTDVSFKKGFSEAFNIKPRLVAIMATNSQDFTIKKPTVLYNLKLNGINCNNAVTGSELKDTFDYAYDNTKPIYSKFNDALNAEYIIKKFTDEKEGKRDELQQKALNYILPKIFNPEAQRVEDITSGVQYSKGFSNKPNTTMSSIFKDRIDIITKY